MNFKTNIIFRTLLIAVFLFGLVNATEAQKRNKPIITNLIKICDQEAFCCGPVPAQPYNCENTTIIGTVEYDETDSRYYVNASLSAYCVDLPNRLEADFVPWPEEEEAPLLLKYEYAEGLFAHTPVINTWEYVADYIKEGTTVTHKVYRGSVNVRFEYDFNCNYPNDENAVMVRNVALYSITPENNYIPYLLEGEGNGSSNGIFSCDVFGETCNFCYTDCEPSGDPAYDVEICTECLSRNPIDNEDYKTTAFQSQAVQPNPFSNFIKYRFFLDKNTEIKVQLFSVNGKEVYQKTRSLESGDHTFSLDTDHLPKGIYYLKINSGERSQTSRLVKME